MLALVNTPRGNAPVELRDVAGPEAAANEAIIEVRAFSLNRCELSQLATRPQGWRPGQDMAGVIVQAAADGSGPQAGSRVVALVDQAGWAQRASALTARMAVLPEQVSFAQAERIAWVAGLALILYGALVIVVPAALPLNGAGM